MIIVIDQRNTLTPLEILAPADTAAVAEAVREAAKEGRAVYPRGGGTSWNYGVRPGVPLLACPAVPLMCNRTSNSSDLTEQ